MPFRRMIVAIATNGVIGVGTKIPWEYPGDQKRFKELTLGTTVIMGRVTWESLGSKPLPKRRNVVLSSGQVDGVETYPTVEEALLEAADEDVWFIGGAGVYASAMPYCDLIDVTVVPEAIEHPDAVHFPPVPEGEWEKTAPVTHEKNPELTRFTYRRVRPAPDSPTD
jgi:dihydrofolate reductase